MNSAYLIDCYLKEFETTVKSVNDKFVVLEDTIFYPKSGGQPHDVGTISVNGETYNVVFVGQFKGAISHEVDRIGLKVGDKVSCVVDWNRRYNLMRMHTAAHVLARIIHDETGANTSGNQLDIDKSRIDFNFENYDKEQVLACFDKANELIRNGCVVEKTFMKKEDALKIPGFAGPSPHLMKDISELRVVDIKGLDVQPCGGTHLDNISEIKGVEFVKADNKGASNRRISFKLVD